MAEEPHGNPGDATKSAIKDPKYKRPMDLFILGSAHLLLLPLWAVLWTVIPVLIWLEDRGPIFYKQSRVGRGGRVFTILKFRTMRENQAEGAPTILATANDPRITRVGKFLRPTALDELPQVLNIFAGQLSVVGPRPEPPDIHEELLRLSPDAARRMQVRPGLTGLAQVRAGYGASLPDKLGYDLQYIDQISLWTDVKLILISIWKTSRGSWEASVSKATKPGRSGTSTITEDRP
jgi:lipopolysaccharide/colanic/teichoic acid biosynthesis glycosyltransferase